MCSTKIYGAAGAPAATATRPLPSSQQAEAIKERELAAYVAAAARLLDLPAAKDNQAEVVRFLRIAQTMAAIVERSLPPTDPLSPPLSSVLPKEAS